MSNVGALATNLHEGTRSEYLAQYIFASFGTAISVPQQEDSGVDLYCTMTETVGRRAWPQHHYTVQVKSTMSTWQFGSQESVRWLVRHPLPLFLCVIDKATARLRLYHTLSRFLVWATGALPDTLELVPEDGQKGHSTQWSDGKTFSLSAPILDQTVMDLQDNNIWAQAKSVMKFWLEIEQQNLTRLSMGLPTVSMPSTYETNTTTTSGTVFQSSSLPERFAPVRATLGELLPWLANYFVYQKDLPGMARAALLLRYLFPQYEGPGTPDAPFVHYHLDEALGLKPSYFCESVDLLSKKFDAILGPKAESEH